MKKLMIILVTLLISVNLYANNLILKDTNRFSGEYALLIFWDTAGLNNLNSNSTLGLKNIEKCKQLISKSSLRKMRVTSISHYGFNEQVSLIGKIESSRTGKLLRESNKIMDDVLVKLEENNSNKAKDVINTFNFINNIVEQSYSDFTKVGVVIFSNLRDSMSDKEQRNNMKKITLNDKVVLHLFSKSGLGEKGASTSQVLEAEKSIIDFYTDKLIASTHITIKTLY